MQPVSFVHKDSCASGDGMLPIAHYRLDAVAKPVKNCGTISREILG
jgi:hypothetical protein